MISSVSEFFGFVLSFLGQLLAVRAILGFVLVFFLPGFAWTLIFFKQLRTLERIALSFALSIVLVTLSVFFVTRMGLKITGFDSFLIIIVVTILPVIAYYINRAFNHKREKAA